MNFSFAKKQFDSARKAVRDTCITKFKINRLKKIEFRDKGQDDKTILNKLRALYIYSLNYRTEVDDESFNTRTISGTLYIKDSSIENLAGEAMSN
jgi:hypothetical protein